MAGGPAPNDGALLEQPGPAVTGGQEVPGSNPGSPTPEVQVSGPDPHPRGIAARGLRNLGRSGALGNRVDLSVGDAEVQSRGSELFTSPSLGGRPRSRSPEVLLGPARPRISEFGHGLSPMGSDRPNPKMQSQIHSGAREGTTEARRDLGAAPRRAWELPCRAPGTRMMMTPGRSRCPRCIRSGGAALRLARGKPRQRCLPPRHPAYFDETCRKNTPDDVKVRPAAPGSVTVSATTRSPRRFSRLKSIVKRSARHVDIRGILPPRSPSPRTTRCPKATPVSGYATMLGCSPSRVSGPKAQPGRQTS